MHLVLILVGHLVAGTAIAAAIAVLDGILQAGAL